MKNFKSRNRGGFSFIEVVATVFIVGTMLSSLLLLQGTIVDHLATASARLGHVLLLKNYLAQAAISREKKEPFKDGQTKKIDEPLPTVLRYVLKKPSRESSLNSFESIMIEHGIAEWTEIGQKRDETMITFLFKPEKQQA